MGRNIFRDTGLQNVDLSISQKWKIRERWDAQFRVEFFNVFNHPNFANPFGGQNGWAHNDPSSGSFGCSCATPDVAASNPVIGSGVSRAVQFGLKLSFRGLLTHFHIRRVGQLTQRRKRQHGHDSSRRTDLPLRPAGAPRR